MSVPKLKPCISSALKLKLKPKPSSKQTINLSILETHLQLCKTIKQFNQTLCQTIVTSFIQDTYAASRVLKFSTDSHFIHIDHSHKIFTSIENSNAFIYNTMMRAYVQRKCTHKVLGLYKLMLLEGVEGDHYTYPILVQACGVRISGFEGEEVHGHVLKMGFDSDVYVLNTLLNMYAVCGRMGSARKLFEVSPVLDSVSWNSVLAGYVQTGNVDEAVFVYERMPERNVIASNSMIVLFGRSGRVSEGYKVFMGMDKKDVVSWSALISCYEQNEMYNEALGLFVDMIGERVGLDEVVLVSVLSACARLSGLLMGKSVHGLAVKIGIGFYVNLQNAMIHMYSCCGDVGSAQELFNAAGELDQISWNSMISGYLRCGSVENAELLFESMPMKDIVSWSAMISGYAQHGHFSKSLDLFREMLVNGIMPDETTLVSVISACTHMAALDQGKWVHAYIKKNKLKINVILGTTLVDMYMKCGCVDNALEVFYRLEGRGVTTWNALILGLATNGLVDRSLHMFSEMKNCGMSPNEVTFIGVLAACRHMGLVDEGQLHFNSMVQIYEVEPNVKHYGCMVDLLGRAGMLKEAEELIESMPMAPDVATWGALLGACKKHGDQEMGERIGRALIELQPEHDGFHVLLSNICASKGNWDNVLEIRGMMTQHGVVKSPGCSMIEENGVVHEFLAGDKTHPYINEIEDMLEEVAKRLKKEGYTPDTKEVFLDIDEEEKETTLFRHSEKLAAAFGLIAITPPTPIRIIKNLRICNDCHIVFKFISKAFDRELIVRDRHRFHHFKHGSCSCLDYW